ncbi:MAG: hypothetical protein U1E91_03805 [Moraxella sp.]
MKLESVHLKNFRAFKELKLDFHLNLNVIAGIKWSGQKKQQYLIFAPFLCHILFLKLKKGTSQRAIKINELDIFNKSNETSASAKFKDDFIKNDVNNFIVLNQTRIGFGKSKNNEIERAFEKIRTIYSRKIFLHLKKIIIFLLCIIKLIE